MTVDNIIIYSRKSRQDDPNETIEEVLSKHEQILQEFSMNQFGDKVPEDHIYREVVSGDSIEDRVEIKKVLRAIESVDIEAILVVEPQRLSRGDLIDCGSIMNALMYTNTKVITPTMTYDLTKKMEQRFFQDELMRGRDYLEYTKEILGRGKIASVKRGCYIISKAPYGYDKIRIGKDTTLVKNDNAPIVEKIFEWYVSGMTTCAIAADLDAMGVDSPSSDHKWKNATIDKMLRNLHYIGKVYYQKKKKKIVYENGVKRKKSVNQDEYIIAQGKHEPIVSEELFNKAQTRLDKRPPLKKEAVLKNIFAGVLRCSKCGQIMTYKRNSETRQYLSCNTSNCLKSAKYDVIKKAVIDAIETQELPRIEAKKHSSGQDNKFYLKEMAKLLKQEQNQYELVETKVYSKEVFRQRNKELRQKISQLQAKIDSLSEPVDYDRTALDLQQAIKMVKEDSIPVYEQNLLIRSLIERIDYDPDQLTIIMKV